MVDTLPDLLYPAAIRSRCHQVGQLAEENQTPWFQLDNNRFDHCVDLVVAECISNYPDLNIPYHSRWRHFVVDNVNLWDHYSDKNLGDMDAAEKTRIAIDLVFLSVLLDAGAGSNWVFIDPVTNKKLTRSEGLAAASVSLFFNEMQCDGLPKVNQTTLSRLSVETLSSAFQHSTENPLIGVKGRHLLLQNLADTLGQLQDQGITRPGDLYDLFLSDHQNGNLPMGNILTKVLRLFNDMWPSGLSKNGISLGDCGIYSPLKCAGETSEIIPFHKLSQWLSYSLVEPLQWAGITVTHFDQLTGLPEYRNGGLFLDCGLLKPKQHDLLNCKHATNSEPVVEWRALSVYLLDQIAEAVRNKLEKTASQLPLTSVLQGGTWSAGRALAYANRKDGRPPIALAIDGTVF